MAEPWIDTGEYFTDLISARIAAHDYAHLGWRTRVKRIGSTNDKNTTYELHVQYGRQNFPSCCRLKPRWRVPEDKEQILWKKDLDKNLKRRWQRNMT
jgi:hypothetical protein